MSSVTGIGRSSSGCVAATTAPLATSMGASDAAGVATGEVCTTTGFKSTCCTWCAANTSSLHSIPL